MPSTTRSLARLLAAVPAAAGMSAAFAAGQQEPPARPPVQQVEVKGSAAAYDARRDDTATRIVITQAEILKHGDTTIGEVLKRLPGVTLGGVQGRGGEIRMRGLGSGYTQVLLNGEPVPPGFSLDALAPDTVERIEVMRSASAEYSTQAIAGAINIVLKKQVHSAQKDIKAGLQSENGKPGASLNFQLSDKAGALAYAIGGGLAYGSYDRPSSGTTSGSGPDGADPLLWRARTTNVGRTESLNLAPRLTWTLGPDDVLTSQSFATLSRLNANVDEWITREQGALPPYSGTSVGIDSHAGMFRTDLAWTRKLAAGARLDTKAGVNYNHRQTTAPSEEYYADRTLALSRVITSGQTDKGLTANGKYSTPVLADHALAIGWDATYSKRIEDRIQRESSTVGAPAENLDQFYAANVGRLALFGQDEWSVTPQWSLYLGLRWEGIRTRSAGDGYAAVDNRSSVWSPLFQTLYKIPGSKNDQLRLALARTYKAPAVTSLVPRRFASNNNSQTNPDLRGNPELRPELAWGLDLAWEHYLAGGGMLGVSTFVRRIEDTMHQRVVFANGLWVQTPFNDGVARARGVELEAKLPLRSMFKAAPALDLRANVARNWSTISTVPGPDNRLDQQTPVSGNLGLDYKMDTLPLSMGGSYSFQDGGPVRVALYQYAYSTPKRALDLYALWSFSPKTQLRLSLANALHQQNVTASTWADPDGTLTDASFTPTASVLRAQLEMKL